MADESDVLIVGSGVAGALIASRLASAGLNVTIVEAGPEIDRGAAIERLSQAAIRVPEAPYPNPPYAESPVTIDDTYIRQIGPDLFRSTYLRQVGGTTWHWLGTALRLLPHDFELHTRYGVGVDWPLTYADLAPWYDAAETELGVSGHDDSLGSPRQKPYPMPGLPATLGDRLMDQASAPLGFRVRVSPQARNAQPFDNRPACCASASCIPLCPVQAKYDATVHVAKAVSAGARIFTESVAVRVDVTPDDGLASGVTIRRPDRSEMSLSARHIVIAANAIEGPKLLLMSRSDQWPNGVANSSGAVGRYLMDHPVQLTRALSPVPVWQRRGPQEVSAIHEMRDGGHRRRHGALLINVGNQGWEWAGPDLAELTRRFVAAGLSGSNLLNAVRSHASRETTLVALTEQLPDPDNRIGPDFQRLDAIGVPKPRVFFRLDPYTTAALAAARGIHERLFQALGATDIGHTQHAEGAGHIMGTTRMGADPRISVADASGRSHDHRNLWLAGASLFPTCGTANPTLTIAALALRIAEAIKVAAGR